MDCINVSKKGGRGLGTDMALIVKRGEDQSNVKFEESFVIWDQVSPGQFEIKNKDLELEKRKPWLVDQEDIKDIVDKLLTENRNGRARGKSG